MSLRYEEIRFARKQISISSSGVIMDQSTGKEFVRGTCFSDIYAYNLTSIIFMLI
jgi:hypothetical protein